MVMSRTIIMFGLIILAFDGLWAAVVRLSNSDYSSYASLWWVSLLIYTATGFVAARRNTVLNSILAAMAVAAIEATLGWGLSALIGPGATPTPQPLGVLLISVIFVILSGGVCGLVGTLLSRLLWRTANA